MPNGKKKKGHKMATAQRSKRELRRTDIRASKPLRPEDFM